MPELSPIFLATLTGFGFGLMLSMPVGPVNLTIINGGVQRGFKYAMLIGLGAATMDTIYCMLAFAGFPSFFGIRIVKTSMEVFTFAFMLFLGAKFLTAKTVTAPTQLGKAASRIEKRIDEKFHPHSAFMTGFVRVMGNLGVLLLWIVLTANFMSRDWVEDTLYSKLACIAGVALGANLWFFAVSYTSSRGHKQLSERTLLRMEQFSGICLIVIGLAQGAHIAWQLARHRHGI
jgi:threonine/homoserine/homoserine lactone efflux protein